MIFNTTYTKLSNGVRVLLVPMAGVESVTTMILVKTGSRNETEEQAGISHVLEHMVFKGTKKYPSPMAIAEAVDGIGAEQNAFTSKEYTGYYITSAAQHLPLALDIQSEMLTVPLLPQDDLNREREVIVEEINMYEDQPMAKAGEEFENLMYAGSSLGREIIGTKETVRATTSEHLRKYMGEWYYGGNMLVVVAGKVGDKKEVIEQIEAKLGSVKQGGIMDYVSAGGYGKAEARHYKKKTEQAHFYMGVPAISMHDPRRYALQLSQVVLGGGMSSRLFNEIREKRGLAYYVKADIDMTYDTGYLAVRAGVKLSQLAEALKVVKEEMLKLGGTITEAELTKAKEYLLGRMPLSLEESMGVAQFFGMRVLIKDEIVQPDQVVKKIKDVTMEEVKAICEELVKESEIRSVVVGPKQN
ncbi:peptidase M16 [Candidatus Microgenomates bacterium]|nr:insulinase family protein [Candidatus Microgenomates bacterium CPR3]RIK51344.1 MAG: peptidase M16 [Candidatus Microgenomates bacterium]